jgi:chromosome segregation ATPase
MNLLILARTIERARAAVLAGTEELRGLRVAAKQGEEELIRVTEAKEALESQLEALESQRELFETKRAEAEAATQRAVDELASRANELKAEQDRHHKLTAQIQAQEQELEAARGKCDRAAEQLSAAEQELAALQRRHAEELTRVESERQILAECAMRMAASRSWRYGHSLSRILRRMTLRPPVKSQSALDVMLSILAPDAARLGAGDGPQQPPLLSSPTDS